MRNRFLLAGFAGAVLFLSGCHSPQVTQSVQISPDDDPLGGGINSNDVRTLASQMAPKILGLPEVADQDGVIRIVVADFRNNSRFLIDRNLFMRRLRLELNRYGDGKIRFITQNERVQRVRTTVLEEKQQELVLKKLKELGKEIAAIPLFQNAKTPVKVAVIPVINTNLVNLNGDSFAAMLRAEIAKAGKGKIQFLMPGDTSGADYYLTGQFIPESMRKEGIINLLDYVEVIDKRLKHGLSLDVTDGRVPNTSNTNPPIIGNQIDIQRESALVKLMMSPEMRAKPNVNKRLNIMLVSPKDKVAVYENMFLIDRQITTGQGKANFILSGEISAMSSRRQGNVSDYLLISVQLTDPENNEMVWEDAYETKRVTKAGIVYQ